ncbi:hypothetical protein ACJMK2_006749 [Sinanodonta woodiana]|uniref:WDR11 TPR domain-containing protein n=1 Tax=Sinanodonta woodiana TaxID=1069815 RepID=A0ABD3VXK9_SINWO
MPEAVNAEIIFITTSSDSTFILRFCMRNNIIGEQFNAYTLQDLLEPNAKSIDIILQCWKGAFAIFGTSDGILLYLDVEAKKLRKIVERPGLRILRLSFAPGPKPERFFVLCENEISIWIICKNEAKICGTMMSPKNIPRIVKAEWIDRSYLLLATDEGNIYITKWNKMKWVPHIGVHTLSESTCRPHLLTPYASMTLKLRLLCSPYHRETDTVYFEKLAMIAGMDLGILTMAETAERCYNVARLFGDDHDMNFWRLAMMYIQKKSHQIKESTGMNSHKRAERELQPRKDKTILLKATDQQTVESCFGILRDNESFAEEEIYRLEILTVKRKSKVYKDQCVRRAIMFGSLNMALQLLVENDVNNDTFLTDYLTACLISSERSSIECMTTIKMVATHLMSIGQLDDGIQLLCLIDKHLDACKYLQSSGHWYRSVWLAKVTLSEDECKEVLTNWANHLWEENEKSKAILVMLGAGDVLRVIRMLAELGRIDTAALFIEACIEKVVITKDITAIRAGGDKLAVHGQSRDTISQSVFKNMQPLLALRVKDTSSKQATDSLISCA